MIIQILESIDDNCDLTLVKSEIKSKVLLMGGIDNSYYVFHDQYFLPEFYSKQMNKYYKILFHTPNIDIIQDL